MRVFALLVLLCVVYVRCDNNPVANPAAVVIQQKARFTVLTDRMLRIEYSASGKFEDAASQVVLNRNLAVPNFQKTQSSSSLVITTKYLTVTYSDPGTTAFNSTNLKIQLSVGGKSVTWAPGTVDTGNLLGTIRTLDGVRGSVDLNCRNNPNADELYCTYGLISEDGWTLYDDSLSALFDSNNYQWLLDRPTTDSSDWYFMGYARDFKAALYDFTTIAGKMPLPPRYAFGVFFSRYWAYNDRETKHIVTEYEQHQTPLDVIVTDMDWHITFYKEANEGITDQAGQPIGWTGYTWDNHLFPNPQAFFNWCKTKNLRNTLNLHPASGVQPWEAEYSPMAIAMGIDPSTQIYVPFDINNFTFTTNFMDIVLRPVENQGLDFWWLDWQAWTNGNPNPTWMLNYVFFTNPERIGSTNRGMILHRWGGMGNHRFQMGFSGDVVPAWDSLAFQPYFTQTAGNVLFGYWSHDIGGHTQPCPPELYTRWVQWGVWSPVFRTHCTKNPSNDRRIWTYPLANFQIMRDAIALRSQMLPYIYSQARVAYDTAISLVHPLYYDYPDDIDAYNSRWSEFMFGSDILVAPVTDPLNVWTRVATKYIYLPAGTWIEWNSGDVYVGPRTIKLDYTLEETPVFVRAGTILPMLPEDKPLLGSAQEPYTSILFTVFPYSTVSGSTFLYEDDGVSDDYMMTSGGFANTSVTYKPVTPQNLQVTINPTQGKTFVSTRTYEFAIVGVFPPSSVKLNGVTIPFVLQPTTETQGWTYDGETFTVKVWSSTSFATSSTVTLNVYLSTGRDLTLPPLSGYVRCVRRLQKVKSELDQQWGSDVYDEDYYPLLTASETGQRITDDPSTAFSEYMQFPSGLQQAINIMESYDVLSEDIHASVNAWLQTCSPAQ